MYLRTLEISVLKYTNLIQIISAPELTWQATFKKAKIRLDLLIDMLIMVEKGITGGICHSIDMQKLITKTRNTMTKAKNHDILGYK